MSNEIITAKEAARRLGRGKETIEKMLRENEFPVGFAYYNKESDRFTYIIPREGFDRMMRGELKGTRIPFT